MLVGYPTGTDSAYNQSVMANLVNLIRRNLRLITPAPLCPFRSDSFFDLSKGEQHRIILRDKAQRLMYTIPERNRLLTALWMAQGRIPLRPPIRGTDHGAMDHNMVITERAEQAGWTLSDKQAAEWESYNVGDWIHAKAQVAYGFLLKQAA